jgi:hypothetical protein
LRRNNLRKRKTLTQNKKRNSYTTALRETSSELPIRTNVMPLVPSCERCGLGLHLDNIPARRAAYQLRQATDSRSLSRFATGGQRLSCRNCTKAGLDKPVVVEIKQSHSKPRYSSVPSRFFACWKSSSARFRISAASEPRPVDSNIEASVPR